MEDIDVEHEEPTDNIFFGHGKSKPPPTKKGSKLFCKCAQCKESFSNVKDLTTHVLIHRGESEKLFQCGGCDLVFQHASRLLRHSIVHSAVKSYKCKNCPKMFKDFYLLRQHAVIHKEKLYECLECRKKFRVKQLFDAHKEDHSKGLKCDYCVKIFDDEKDLLKHQYDYHVKEHSCSQCDFKANSLKGLKSHMTLKHKTVGARHPAKCDFCEKVFCRRVFLDRHLAEWHFFKCINCEQIFQSRELLKQHVNTHHGLQCLFCDKQLSGKFSLERHIHCFHNWKCRRCDKVFTSEEKIVEHMKADHTVTHKCEQCVEGFRRKSLLIEHIKASHTDPVTQPQSDVVFDKKYSTLVHPNKKCLKRHFKRHEEGRYIYEDDIEIGLYECDKCERTFESFHERENHGKVHIDTLGNFTINTESNKKVNLESMPAQELKCPSCEEAFELSEDLEKHSKCHIKTEVMCF